MRYKGIGIAVCFVLLFGFLLPPLAYADDTDLEIKPETISQWAYYTAALTDRYDVELLTKEAYEQARAIAERQEEAYRAAQTALFSAETEGRAASPPLELTEQLGLFGKDYTVYQLGMATQKDGGDLWLVVGVLLFGTAGGCALAVLTGKKKGRGREKK